MEKEIYEVLEIKNFLSFKQVKWEFSQFNIITGDMGTGKSLCIKLLKYFEDIIPNLLIMSYNDFSKNLDSNSYFRHLICEFTNIFHISSNDDAKLPFFEINYVFSYKEEMFNVTITGNNEKNIHLKSSFLENLLTRSVQPRLLF